MPFTKISEKTYQAYIERVRTKEGKHVFWLSKPRSACRVGCVIFNNVFPNVEVHMKSSDVWYVVSGEGVFILSGKLENVVKSRPDECAAGSILGGKLRRVKTGDIIDIPAGVPHQIDARGKFLVMLIIKINA